MDPIIKSNLSTDYSHESDSKSNIEFVTYTDESMLPDIQRLVTKDLSEPYSVFTYRYFLHNWPGLCICVYVKSLKDDGSFSPEMIGTIVCKAEALMSGGLQGYIAMLAVDKMYRNRGIGSILVAKGIDQMVAAGCHEILLEAEASNKGALSLYTRMGFMKDDHMIRYYLNGGDAFRLKLWIDRPPFYTPLIDQVKSSTSEELTAI